MSKDTFFLSEGSDKVMRCAQILAFLMHNVEVPVVMRQTIKCAALFFKLVEFNDLKLHQSTILEATKSSELLKGIENQFLLQTLKQIGQKISNTKETPAVEEKEEKLYVVYANVNCSDEDYSFLITTLYHWETLYPTFTLELPKDPSEIVVKPAKPKEEEKKDADGASDPLLPEQKIA